MKCYEMLCYEKLYQRCFDPMAQKPWLPLGLSWAAFQFSREDAFLPDIQPQSQSWQQGLWSVQARRVPAPSSLPEEFFDSQFPQLTFLCHKTCLENWNMKEHVGCFYDSSNRSGKKFFIPSYFFLELNNHLSTTDGMHRNEGPESDHICTPHVYHKDLCFLQASTSACEHHNLCLSNPLNWNLVVFFIFKKTLLFFLNMSALKSNVTMSHSLVEDTLHF